MASIRHIIDGLEIQQKYLSENVQIPGADHDIIWGPLSVHCYISEEDEKRLLELGWHRDTETEQWSRFV